MRISKSILDNKDACPVFAKWNLRISVQFIFDYNPQIKFDIELADFINRNLTVFGSSWSGIGTSFFVSWSGMVLFRDPSI